MEQKQTRRKTPGRPRKRKTSQKKTQKQTILVVEDDRLNMRLYEDVLETKGYDIVKAFNGSEAVYLMREAKPDLVLLDIQLPEISGLEVTRIIRSEDTLKAVPVIAVTALAVNPDPKTVLSAGCDAYVAKPISISNLLSLVQHLLTCGRNGAGTALGQCMPAPG